MSKKDSQSQSNHDETEIHNESHNEVHVETHTESHVSAGSAPTADDAQDRINELTADLQRVQAEFVNYRRRADAEKADVLDFAKARIARDFLTVRDSFDAEAAHRPVGADPDWAKSIDAIRTQFDQVLSGLGVVRFESTGQPFDPHLHNAVAMDDSAGPGPEIVIEELQPGYKLGDTVIRPAMVKVGHAHL